MRISDWSSDVCSSDLYRGAVRMLRPASPNWRVPVQTCSALTGAGIDKAWDLIGKYRRIMGESGELDRRRAAQARDWMWAEIGQALTEALKAHRDVKGRLAGPERPVQDGRLTPTAAARAVLAAFPGEGRRADG